MKVTFITSACILIEYPSGFKVLCDPWLTEGIYYGTWMHNPPLQRDWIQYFNNNPPDAIYISHIHPDHCDLATLVQLKFLHGDGFRVPIYVAKYNSPALENILEGFKVRTELNPRFVIFKANGLEIDSFAMFSEYGINVLNMNDCVFEDVKDQLQFCDIDLACLPYSGASSYPQCFDSMSDTEKQEGKEKSINKYLKGLALYTQTLNPKVVLPFAGQYKFADKSLNKWLAMPDLIRATALLRNPILPIEGAEYYVGLDKLHVLGKTHFYKYYKGNCTVSFETENWIYEGIINSENHLKIKLPEKLLWELLTKRKHWNNAELGGLLRFERVGDYDAELHYYLSYFHI